MTTFQKVIKYLAIALAAFVIFGILMGIIGMFTGFSFFFGGRTESKKDVKPYTFEEEFHKLDIDLDAAELIIKKGEAEKLTVKYNKKTVNVSNKNGILTVKDVPSSRVVHYVEVILPKSDAEGTMQFDAEIDIDAGKLDADMPFVNNFDLDIDAGKADVNVSALNADVEVSAGQLNIGGEFGRKSKFKVGTGEINLDLTGEKDSYSFEVKKGVGDVKIDGKSVKDGYESGNSSKIISLDVGVGSVDVDFR